MAKKYAEFMQSEEVKNMTDVEKQLEWENEEEEMKKTLSLQIQTTYTT